MKQLVISLLVLAAAAFPIHAQTKSNAKGATKPGQKSGTEVPGPDFKKCEELLQKSVARVQTKSGIGTGFAIGDGTLIVTNDHVVRGRTPGTVEDDFTITTQGNDSQKAKLLITMPHRDLAALKVETPLTPLLLAQEDQFMHDTPVMVVGHGQAVQNLQNTGLLTNLTEWSKWGVRSSKMFFANDTYLLTTDATIHPGHSGSPLVTPDGLVVGAMTFIDVTNAKGNMAVHVSHIRELVEKADPAMTLVKGKLSSVERIRIERARRSDALQQLNQQAQTKSQNKVIDATPMIMFFNIRNSLNRY